MALESIALIPSGVKATKVYSQLPVNGNGDFTFDRGTSADQTRVNKNGLIESVAQDVPRLDYLDGGCPSLLLEPASTNLITYSEDFTNPSWIKANGGTGVLPVVTSNFALSPDGSVNADRVQFDLGGGTTSADLSWLQFSYSSVSGNDYTSSVYLKLNSGSAVVFLASESSSQNEITITNEWVRFDFTQTSASTTSRQFRIGLRGNLSVSDTADILIWGAQLEQQSYATSYMPSLLGVNGDRDAETCNGAGTTAEINSQEGVLFFEGRALQESGGDRAISLTDGGTLNSVSMFNFSTANTVRYLVFNGGATQCSIDHTLIDITNYHKVALYYKQDDFRLYVNGLLVGLDPSGSVFSSGTLNQLELEYGASAYRGRVKKLSVYNDTTQDLEQLTGFTSFAEMSSYLSYS